MHPVLFQIPAALVAVFFGALIGAISAAVFFGVREDRRKGSATPARDAGAKRQARVAARDAARGLGRLVKEATTAGVLRAGRWHEAEAPFADAQRETNWKPRGAAAAEVGPEARRGGAAPAGLDAGGARRSGRDAAADDFALGHRTRTETTAAAAGALVGGLAGFFLVGRRLSGAVPVYSYGVMLASAFVCGWFVVMRIGTTREQLPRERLAAAFLITGAFAILGARLLFVLTNLDTLPGPASWLSFREGGVVAYGGFLGGLFGGWLAWRRRGVGLLTWGDIAAPAIGLGLGLTRIGCYLYGCDFGRPLGSDAPGWLRTIGTFPGARPGLLPSPAFLDQLARHQLSPGAATSLPVHPTQLYESLLGFALFFVALAIWRHRRFRGQALLALTVLYGIARFLLEIVRDDSQRGIYFGLSTSQWISLALVPLGLALYLRLRRAAARVPMPARESVARGGRASLSSR